MNIEPMWILGTGVTILGGGFAGYVSLTNRLTRIETTINLIGKKAANILYSPHTPELDELLKEYIESNHDLPQTKWERMEQLVLEIESSLTEDKDKRLLAAIVAALADHKLMRYRGKKIC